MTSYLETGVPPTLLFRRAHWCVPRKILGLIPMEWLLHSRFGQGTLPRWYTCGVVEGFVHSVLKPLIWLYWRIVEAILTLQLGLWGSSCHLRPTLPIEDDMYCGHGVICHPDTFPWFNSQKIQTVKGSIQKVLPTGEILLDDGTTIVAADEIVFATGFQRAFDFLPRELLDRQEHDGFYAYRQMIVPGVPTIAFLNNNVTTFSNITTPTIQAAWLGALLKGEIRLPKDMADQVEREKQWRRKHLPYAGNARAFMIQLHQLRYWDTLLCDMGINVKRKTSSMVPLVGPTLQNFFCPMHCSDYKSIATGEYKTNKNEICPLGYKPSWMMEWTVLIGLISGMVALTH